MTDTQDRQLQKGNRLLKAVRESEIEIPGVAPICLVLEKAHAQAVSSKSRRKALATTNREATRQLNEDLAAVRDATLALRSFIKSVLGFRNPELGRYGIKPLRRRAVKERPT